MADPVQNTQIDDSIFIHPEHLHLTLAVFPLLDEAEKGKAIEIFLECKQLILPHLKKSKDQLRLELVGVDSMEDFTDDSQVHVLYAKVQHEGLQEIANIFSARFAEEGTSAFLIFKL